MGLGERQQESDNKAVEEGSLKPFTNKDPKKAAYNPIQGILQKHKSHAVPLNYILLGIIVILIIVITVLAVRRETPETKVVQCSTSVQCMDDWVLYRGKFYYLSNLTDTWPQSQNFCKSHDSSLAIIDNEKELNFLNLLKSNDYWIGLSRTQDDSGWVWIDGTSISETLYNISRKIPLPGESEHVYLNGKGFRSESEKYKKKWICSKSFLGHPP